MEESKQRQDKYWPESGCIPLWFFLILSVCPPLKIFHGKISVSSPNLSLPKLQTCISNYLLSVSHGCLTDISDLACWQWSPCSSPSLTHFQLLRLSQWHLHPSCSSPDPQSPLNSLFLPFHVYSLSKSYWLHLQKIFIIQLLFTISNDSPWCTTPTCPPHHSSLPVPDGATASCI